MYVSLLRALELQSQGFNQSEIGDALGVSRRSVSRILKGKSLRAYKADYWLRYRANDVADMVKDRDRGESLHSIAARYKLNEQTLSRILRTGGPDCEG